MYRWRSFLILAMLAAAGVWPAIAAEDLQHLTPRGRVNDFAGVMTPAAVQQVEAALADLERRTGAQVAVVTVPSVPGGDVDRAAVDLFQRWGIGQRGQDNGVLLLCAIQDRRARMEVGYGLEGVLPDALTGRLMDVYLIPAFRQGDYSAGLVNTTRAVAQIIARDAGITLESTGPPAAAAPRSLVADGLLILGLFGVLVFLVWLQARRQRKGYRGGWWWYGGGGYRGGGGGFGGFGGGRSGGGGAGRGW